MKEIKKELEKFKEDVSKEYFRTRIIPHIVNVIPVNETDSNYTQIAIRQGMPKHWFEEDSHTNSFGFLGKAISLGELNYLIETIKKDQKIPIITCNELKQIVNEIYNLGPDVSVIMHIDFFYEFFYLKKKKVLLGGKKVK